MEFKEELVKVPWGNVATLSCGNPKGEKVLLVHGRLDSAATYIPLLRILPKKYCYVGFDMPGNGKSDPFPKGTILSRFIGVVVIDLIVKHLGWKKFIYFGHSLGAEQGMFYSAIYPKHIKKAIFLDPGPSINWCKDVNYPVFFKETYENFYDNCHKYDYEKEYTMEEAIKAVRNNRALNEEQAKMILSRNLIETGPDTYKLSWDRRYKNLATFNAPPEYYYELFTLHPPPSLLICSIDLKPFFYSKKSVTTNLINIWEEKCKNVKTIWVEGTHDLHFTRAEKFIDDVLEFLEKPIVKAKI
ncbi:serine hydrolase-like protein [Colias croceus]|uniref:serine hydrolase-like protein n=1 Tax=Colias crocea TaxID=72248 RepID=UPI001E27AC95|nr:serine hydrolase-like protein [Colias croceus]